MVRTARVKGLAVRGIALAVVVVVRIARVASTVFVEIVLLSVGRPRTIVIFVEHPVLVIVGGAVGRAALFAFVLFAAAVATIRRAVARAGLQGLGKTAHPIPARPAIHGA